MCSEPGCSVSENKPKETGGIFSFGSTGGGGGSSSGSTPFSFGAKTAAPTSSAAKTELPKPDVTDSSKPSGAFSFGSGTGKAFAVFLDCQVVYIFPLNSRVHWA